MEKYLVLKDKAASMRRPYKETKGLQSLISKPGEVSRLLLKSIKKSYLSLIQN
ncbi:hypothetical protein QWY86_17670 [Pedobacter aquatilis]|uniref:hypothetical protein n=1 Tax=Pedobacter aquatilis TaxID=351343 RepID=UPI0025B5CFB7|nr:hypothetical protein [Pedobacter aquatilis]MDN3588515.1 hypothetical protein [Pedobacter aquatilis]